MIKTVKLYKIIHRGKNPAVLSLICSELRFAESFIERLFGLIFKKIKNGQGFAIKNCNSIHTFWMKYRIDVIFLDSDNKIIKQYESLKQFRITPVIKDACVIIEFPEFTIHNYMIKTGDRLKFI